MKGTWEKSKDFDKHKHKYSFDCLARRLNLLLKDLCVTIGKILSKIKEIVKNFKSSGILHTTFKKKIKIKIIVKLQYQQYNYLVILDRLIRLG
jgi:hypothetical protein